MQVLGEWEANPAIHALGRIRDTAAANQLTRILIDCAGLSPPRTETDRFYTGEAIARVLKYPYRSVAILPATMINKLAENVAVNRGARFFVTHDEEAALQWLLS